MKKYKNPMKAVREIREELQSILKDYHYESDTENMSKDVVVALENLVGALKWNIAKVLCVILTTQRIGNEDQKETKQIKLGAEVGFIICKGTRVLYNVKMIGFKSLGNAPLNTLAE